MHSYSPERREVAPRISRIPVFSNLVNVPDRQQVNTLREAGAKVGVAVIPARTLYSPSRHLIHVHGPTGGALLPGTAWDALWHGVLTFPSPHAGRWCQGGTNCVGCSSGRGQLSDIPHVPFSFTARATAIPPAHFGSFRKNATAAGAPNHLGASQDRRFGDRSEVSQTDIEWDSRREWP
jgi:hypothetical protein